MLNIPAGVAIYLHTRPTDMRKSFDGLCGIIRGEFGRDPLDGGLFLFLNRRRNRVKLLWWDHDGLALWATLYPKYACVDHPQCGVTAPLRPRGTGRGQPLRHERGRRGDRREIR